MPSANAPNALSSCYNRLFTGSVRAVNRYWCSSRRRRVFRPIPERRSNRSDHYVTSIIGGITPPRIAQQCPIPVQQEEIQI